MALLVSQEPHENERNRISVHTVTEQKIVTIDLLRVNLTMHTLFRMHTHVISLGYEPDTL